MDKNDLVYFVTEKDIKGDEYKRLLNLSLKECEFFKLTIYFGEDIDIREEQEPLDIIKDPRRSILEPYFVAKRELFIEDEELESNTIQFGNDYIFTLNESSVSALLKCSQGLFDWGWKGDCGFFENLTLLYESGLYWLESTPHESCNAWELSRVAMEKLITTLDIKDDIYIID